MRTFWTDGLKSIELAQYPDSAWTFYTEKPKDYDEALFGLVAMMFRAINLSADAIASLPYAVFRGATEVDSSQDWQNTVGFMPNPGDLLRRWRMSQMFTNAAYGFMESSKGQRNLRYIVADTITPITSTSQGVIGFKRKVGNQVTDYPYEPGNIKNRIIPLWLLDHTTELIPSDNTEFRSAMKAAGILYYTDYFIEHFFKRGRVVPSIIGVKGVVNDTQRDKIERGFSQILKNAYKYVTKVFNAEAIEIHELGASIDALQDTTLYQQSIQNIAAAFGLPLSLLLSNSASYATALEEKKTWFNNKIVPDAKKMEYSLNTELFEAYGYRFEFQYEASDEGTQEEVQRATSISTFMDFLQKAPTANIAIETAESVFGYELTDKWKAYIVTYFNDKETKAEEMRENMNDPQEDDQQPGRPAAGRPTAQFERPPAPPQPVRAFDMEQVRELTHWQTFANRRVKKGEDLSQLRFELRTLPDDVGAEIRAGLAECKTVEDVTAVFESVTTETKAPEYRQDAEIKALADALNKLAEKSDPQSISLSLPAITVNTPEHNYTFSPEFKAEPAIVNVSVPEQPTPVVNVTNQAEAPVVNVTNDVQPAPVEISQPKEAELIRDAEGRLKGIRTKK